MDILKKAFEDGKPLATIDGVEYRTVTLVCDKSTAGVLPFATMTDWQTTPQALLARRDTEIESLKRRIAELETGAKNPPARVSSFICSECGKSDFSTKVGLAGHRFKKHGLRGTPTA